MRTLTIVFKLINNSEKKREESIYWDVVWKRDFSNFNPDFLFEYGFFWEPDIGSQKNICTDICTGKSCLIWFRNTLKIAKKSGLSSHFSFHFSVSRNQIRHSFSFLRYYINVFQLDVKIFNGEG